MFVVGNENKGDTKCKGEIYVYSYYENSSRNKRCITSKNWITDSCIIFHLLSKKICVYNSVHNSYKYVK